MFHNLQQMMVIAPVNSDENKTEHIAQEYWNEWSQRVQSRPLWRPHFQHHDGDDDGYHTITKCFQTSFIHLLQTDTDEFPRYLPSI